MAEFSLDGDFFEKENLFDDLLDDLAFENAGNNNLIDVNFADTFALEGTQGETSLETVSPNTVKPTHPDAAVTFMGQEEDDLDGISVSDLAGLASPSSMTMSDEPRTTTTAVADDAETKAVITSNTTTASALQATKRRKPDIPVMPKPSIHPSNEPDMKKLQIDELTQIPVSLCKAFNGGDMTRIKEIIKASTLKCCSLWTVALNQDVTGQNYVSDLFEAIYEMHPDAVLVAKKCKVSETKGEISCKIYFAGTRLAKSYTGDEAGMCGCHSLYLFKRKGSTLLDEMDVTGLSEPEKASMRELENLGRNLSVFGKGIMSMSLDADTYKISRFVFDLTITSFRVADI